MKCFFVFGTRLNLSGNDFFEKQVWSSLEVRAEMEKKSLDGRDFFKAPTHKSMISSSLVGGSKTQKRKKKIFFVFLIINLNKLYFLVGHNYWKKNKKSDYQKCNHACIMHFLTAHHSKAHRGIDFEQLVTGEEVRLVKARKFH
jgi:hypothetical protein